MSNILLPDKRLFTFALVALTILGLIAVWYPRFPSMQDYPETLFMAHVASSYTNPEFNWSEYYITNRQIGPYSLFFIVVGLLAKIVPVEAAGKIFISLAVCLTAACITAWNRYYSADRPAWSLLLLFPLLFSQVYYMGFVNYLLSIPILFLALLAHEKLIRLGGNFGVIISYLVLLILLSLAHPYSILVFLILSFVMTLFSSASKKQFVLGLAGPLCITILFALWFFNTFGIAPKQTPGAFSIRWWPALDVVKYFFLPFAGMRITNGPNILVLTAWSAIALLFLFASLKQKSPRRFRLPVLVMLLLSLAGYAVLPFWLGDYSYFNLRMSIVCYFLLMLALGGIQLGKRAVLLFLVLVGGIMLMTIQTQLALSSETEEILPLLGQMKKNEAVYSIGLDDSPAAIDKWYFYQFHSHDHFYYHVIVGGGAAPALFDSKMNRVAFKKDVSIPDIVSEPQFYQYILVRGRLPEQMFAGTHRLAARSATWQLYERNSSPR